MLVRTLSFYRESFSGLSRSAWLLALITFINRSGTMVIPFLSIYLTTKLGFSLEQAGIAMSAFGLGALVGSFLGGYLSDRIGFYPVMFWSLLLGGIMFIALGYVKSTTGIYSTIFIVSIIVESFRPATLTAIGAYSRPENRTRSFSLVRMAINLGWSVGPAIGGFLAGWAGYDTLFWADGLTCIAASIAFRIYLKPKKSGLEAAPEKSGHEEKAPSPYKDRVYLFFLVLTTIVAVVFMQFLSSLPVFYKQELLLSESVIGALLAMNGFLVVVLEMPAVFVIERRIGGLMSMAIGAVLYGLSYLILNLPLTGLAIAFFSMFILSIGEVFNMPFTNTYASNRATDANRGQYMGLFSMSYAVSQVFGPYISLAIADNWGFSVLWYLLAALSVVAYIGFMFLKRLDKV